MYIRRYKQELVNVKQFFADIISIGLYPDTTFEVKGKNFLINGEIAGYYMPLSTGKIQKSTAYPKVTMIGYDEFLIEEGVYHYLPDEVSCFMELYLTISRYRDVIAVFMSNSITMVNPYFTHFGIKLPQGKKRFYKPPQFNGEVLLEICEADAYIERARQTRFALIDCTSYGRYALDNEFVNDSDNSHFT